MTCSTRSETKLVQAPPDSGAPIMTGPGADLACPDEGRRAVNVGAEPMDGSRQSSSLEVLLAAANKLATKLDPAETPDVQEMVDLLCLLTRTLSADVDRTLLAAAGIRMEVHPDRVQLDLPVSAETKLAMLRQDSLEVEFHLRSGDRGVDIWPVLTSTEGAEVGRLELPAHIPIASSVSVDFGEWRLGGGWRWWIEDGKLSEPSGSELTYNFRDQPLLDSTGVDRKCLTAEALVAWAASLPWLGPEPPVLEPGSPTARLYAAAEGLAGELYPGSAPTPARVVDFLCLAVTTLGPAPDGEHLAEARILVEETSYGVRLRMPVRAGVTSPGFRAGFLVLELENYSAGAEILVWRELVPALADHPVRSREKDEDPRFSGIEPSSSWISIDLSEQRMAMGDVRLESRDPSDWRVEPRAGFEDVPVLVGGGCLDPEALRTFAEGLASARAR